MSNPLGSFIWYELMTTDADDAARFYNAVVGWNIATSALPDAQPDYRHIAATDGCGIGGVLGLTPQMCNEGARPCWVGYLHVSDVDATAMAIVADGGHILMPTMTIDVGSFSMVTDPQGVPFYVMAPIAAAGHEGEPSRAYDRHAVGHVSWNELYTTDLAAAKAFYSRYFAFEFNASMPMGPEFGDYCFIDHGGQQIGAMMKKPPHVPVAGWNFYIRVANLGTSMAAIEELGGQVVHGPQEVPGGEWVINGIDPQGASFALVSDRKA